MKSITEGELWDLVETGSKNVKLTRLTDDVIKSENTEYSSHAPAEVVDGENKNDWILVRNIKKIIKWIRILTKVVLTRGWGIAVCCKRSIR